jgi:hypothetical protein
MPLVSAMLRDNARLQSCLVNDSDHVTPGSSGRHVTLIHKCLLFLERAKLAQTDLSGALYGPSTAAAVLAYKQKRDIINRAYQTSADNIVGKMTIARLDQEIARAERAPDRGVCCFEHGGGPLRSEFLPVRFALATPTAARSAFAPVGAPRKPAPAPPPAPVKLNKQLDVIVQRTSTATGVDAVIGEFIDKAKDLLKPHGMSFVPGVALVPAPVPYVDNPFKPQFPVERAALRNAAVNAHLPNSSALRIIFAPFDPIFTNHGITDGGTSSDDTVLVPKYCLINSNSRNPDRATMLHEMIHAAYPGKSPDHDLDIPTSVFNVTETRTQVPNNHAARLASSFFAR